MSPSSKRQSPYEQEDKADVLSLLHTIEMLYRACQTVLNSYTQTTLQLSIMLEAQMLTDKLRVMNKRWHYHLPFKEACTVDFFDWGKKVEGMSQCLDESGESENPDKSVSEYCPSKHFVLDLYESLHSGTSVSGHTPYYQEVNIQAFLSEQEKIRKQISNDWSIYKARFSHATARKVDSRVGEAVIPLSQKSYIIRQTCSDVLRELSEQLYQLNDILTGVFSRDQLIRLTERVINESDYKCRKAELAARRYIANLKNTTPEEELPDLFDMEIQLALETIGKLKYGNSVTRYIGENNYLDGHYLGFGRFLHSLRCEISKDDLYNIMEQLYRIHCIREEIDQQTTIQQEEETVRSKAKAAALAPASSKGAGEIYSARSLCSPGRPPLPSFFDKKLASNKQAVTKYYDILHGIGFYIGRPLMPDEKEDKQKRIYEGWKWKHLREALEKLGFTSSNTTQNGLAKYLAEVFPYLNADSVKRGFNRETKGDGKISVRIVSDIQDVFQPVVDLLR